LSTQATSHTNGGPEPKNGDRPAKRNSGSYCSVLPRSAPTKSARSNISTKAEWSARSSRELPRAPPANGESTRSTPSPPPHHPVHQRPLDPASRRASVSPGQARPPPPGHRQRKLPHARQRPNATRNSGMNSYDQPVPDRRSDFDPDIVAVAAACLKHAGLGRDHRATSRTEPRAWTAAAPERRHGAENAITG